MILCFAMALIFLIISIFLFNGKGGWLIAGYNTMSNEEKARYDKKKLCKAVGWVCIVCSIMLCIMGYLGHLADTGVLEEKNLNFFAFVFIAVIILAIIIAGIYINKKAKR